MSRIPFETLELPPEENPLGHLGQIADAAIGALCAFYRENPATAVGREFNTPGVAATDALYRRMCDRRPEGPLPPPSLPFNGGQCQVDYNVSFFYTVPGTLLNGGGVRVLPGPISGPTSRKADLGYTDWGVIYRDGFSTFIQTGPGGEIDIDLSVARVDGQPDNCGDPSPQLPGPFIGGKLPVLVRPPVLLPPAPGLPAIPIPPIIIPTIQPTFSPTFSPELNINLGPFNFNFNFGGGQPFTVTPPGTLPPSSPPVLPPASDRPPSLPPSTTLVCPPCDCPEVDLGPLMGQVMEVKSRQQVFRDSILECLGYSETVGVFPLGQGVGGEVQIPKNAVAIILTAQGNMPEVKSRKINNPVGQPDVYFAGWTQITLGDGYALPREQISGARNAYWIPRQRGNPVGLAFSWTSVLGVEYSVSAIIVAPPQLPLGERPCRP